MIELLDLGSTPLSAREAGRRQGEVWGEAAAALFGVRFRLTRLRGRVQSPPALRALAERHLPALQRFDEAAHDELLGFAEASGLEPWQLVVLNHYTDFRDIPPDAGGCTTVFLPTSDGPIAGQTWDMHGTAEPFVRLLRVVTEGAPAVVLFTLAGCQGMTGMNAHGVSVCINNLTSSDARVGVLWPALVRRMLRERTAADAHRVLSEAPLGGGHNYLIADARSVFNVETTAVHKRVTHDDAGRFYWHTNHYLHPGLVQYELPRLPTSTTCDRYDLMLRAFSEAPPTSRQALMTLLGSHEGYPKSLCTHLEGDDPAASKTCGGMVCDPTTGLVHAQVGCLNAATWRAVSVEGGSRS